MTTNLPNLHDLAAIGCGPFNLGLAALASNIDDLRFVALETTPEFRWHPGLMLPDATLQVNFLADLVTLVDPTHPLSFLNYLRDVERLYPFYVRERFHMTRKEYEHYLRWTSARLTSIRYSHTVREVTWEEKRQEFTLEVTTATKESHRVRARNLALGIGTEPSVPDCLRSLPPERCIHSAHYLNFREAINASRDVTVVGSGQSGAEIVLDLLRTTRPDQTRLSWFTRTPAFTPLDYTKLVLEMTTPEYIRHFHALPEKKRDQLVGEQWNHYKGVSTDTLEQLHDALYSRTVEYGRTGLELRAGTAVESAHLDGSRVSLLCRHRDTERLFRHSTELIFSATGYKQRSPTFLKPIEEYLVRDTRGRFVVEFDHSLKTDSGMSGHIFVANADLHSHGVAAPDLGICAYRNAQILNAILRRTVYALPDKTAFTSFSPPPDSWSPTVSTTSPQRYDARSKTGRRFREENAS